MRPNLVSQEELMAAGWKKRQIEAALDEPDEVGPAGHWLNTSGKPYSDRDRAAVAAYRIGLQKERPTDAQWRKWADGARCVGIVERLRQFQETFEALRIDRVLDQIDQFGRWGVVPGVLLDGHDLHVPGERPI